MVSDPRRLIENLLPCLGGKEKQRKDVTFSMKGGSQNCTSVKIFLHTNFIVAVISQRKKFPLYCDISSCVCTQFVQLFVKQDCHIKIFPWKHHSLHRCNSHINYYTYSVKHNMFILIAPDFYAACFGPFSGRHQACRHKNHLKEDTVE